MCHQLAMGFHYESHDLAPLSLVFSPVKWGQAAKALKYPHLP